MREVQVVSIAVAAVMAAAAQAAQQAPERTRDRDGQSTVEQVNVGGTPRIGAADALRPVPRLPDGRVDLTGPWVGGGSNADIERDGGLKPGELPLLPWARKLRDSRKTEDEPYTTCLPMSVPRVNPYPWKFAMTYTSRGLTHIYVLHETGDVAGSR